MRVRKALSSTHILWLLQLHVHTAARRSGLNRGPDLQQEPFTNSPGYKTHIPWDEVTFWREWSQTKPSCQAVREVMAITLWAIWKSFASPCTVRQLLIDHLNDEIAASHTIKNPTKREARIKTIHQRWRTKLYWTANNNLPYGYILPRRPVFQPALYDLQVIPEALNEPSRASLEDPFDLPF